MSRSASVSLKRLTVALFHSRGRRSWAAGAGGPSSPGRAGTSSFSLTPVACARSAAFSDGALVWAAAALSMRERNPLPNRVAPFSQLRRFVFMAAPLPRAAARLQRPCAPIKALDRDRRES